MIMQQYSLKSHSREPPPDGCCPLPPLCPLEWVVITTLAVKFYSWSNIEFSEILLKVVYYNT